MKTKHEKQRETWAEREKTRALSSPGEKSENPEASSLETSIANGRRELELGMLKGNLETMHARTALRAAFRKGGLDEEGYAEVFLRSLLRAQEVLSSEDSTQVQVAALETVRRYLGDAAVLIGLTRAPGQGDHLLKLVQTNVTVNQGVVQELADVDRLREENINITAHRAAEQLRRASLVNRIEPGRVVDVEEQSRDDGVD